jgi:hypothetical protein
MFAHASELPAAATPVQMSIRTGSRSGNGRKTATTTSASPATTAPTNSAIGTARVHHRTPRLARRYTAPAAPTAEIAVGSGPAISGASSSVDADRESSSQSTASRTSVEEHGEPAKASRREA